jgi:predicted acetyltransferase
MDESEPREFDRLSDGTVDLLLYEKAPADPSRGWVPALKYRVSRHGSSEPAGAIQLRVGKNEALLTSGNLGYTIDPPHRGHRFAAHACRLLGPVAIRHGVSPLTITCAPDNLASRRTCELLGARLIGIYPVPRAHEMFSKGIRSVCRYEWDPATDRAQFSV